MAKVDKAESEIVRVADELESEMVELEGIARATSKIPLNSEKNILRAADELRRAMGMPERISERLRSIAAALTRLQQRQDAALSPLASLAAEIEARSKRLGAHMERFAELGRAAGEVSAELGQDGPERTTLATAEARLKEIADGARALFEAARDDDFPEIAREADVLKQRLTSLRKRLSQMA